MKSTYEISECGGLKIKKKVFKFNPRQKSYHKKMNFWLEKVETEDLDELNNLDELF
jgi:hypothetical protein